MTMTDPTKTLDELGPRCPVCGQGPVSRIPRLDGHKATEDYCCAADHIWVTSWLFDPPSPAESARGA